MKIRGVAVKTLGGILLSLFPGQGWTEQAAYDPKSVTLSIYDTGVALVNEHRSVNLAEGENAIRLTGLPTRIEPGTVSYSPLSGGRVFELLDQRFEYDLASMESLYKRYQDRIVALFDSQTNREGLLISAPGGASASAPGSPLVLKQADGSLLAFAGLPAEAGVLFPKASSLAYVTPTLLWRLKSPQEGPVSFRLNYTTEGLAWRAFYEGILSGEGNRAFLSIRAELKNDAGVRFDQARVRLISTEIGARTRSEASAAGALRYDYRSSIPALDRTVAGAGAYEGFDLPGPVTLEQGETRYIQMAQVEKLPVSRFYVYDGVKFDRYQRNRHSDWSYGIEFHTLVESHLQFSNSTANGLGVSLPPGLFRLYQGRENTPMELAGEAWVAGGLPGSMVTMLLGPVRGLRGERERTGYSEVVPLHEYEESFEIRLVNETDQEVEIRVVEHLYRASDYLIVKADAEYAATADQTIEFRPVLKPGGKRAVHYTVRYRW